jgi:hypothetical protein
MQLLGNAARLALIGAALIAAAASAGSNSSKPAVGNYSNTTSPPPQQMDPAMALGLWKSSFGAVKVVANDAAGAGVVDGVWVYDRQGEQVVGYFTGTLRGNVLDFTWQEPGADGVPLVGAGYIVFETYGSRFSGRWWTQARDRMGEWTGWRPEATTNTGGSTYGGNPYGGSPYGNYEPPPPPPDDF